MSQITFTIDTADLASVRALAALAEALNRGEEKHPTTILAAAPAPQPMPQITPPAAAPQPMYAPQPTPAIPIQQPVYAPQPTLAPQAAPAPAQAPTPAAPVQQPVYSPQPTQAPQTPHTAAPAAIPTAAPTYTPPAASMSPATPTAPAAPAPGPLPTSSIAFTRDQLGLAGMQLVEAGRRAELINLLASFGVEALTQLPDDKLGDFATALRGMGAKL